MTEDKEYPVHVTNDMIKEYEKMVYKIYYRYFHPAFSYLKKDLIQYGLWGVFLAYQRYELRFSKYIKPIFFYMIIHSKMCHCLKHEKHFIAEYEDEEYDFSQHGNPEEINETFWADIDKICTKLDKKNQIILRKWLLGTEFGHMGFDTKQAIYYRFNKIKKIVKEYYNEP